MVSFCPFIEYLATWSCLNETWIKSENIFAAKVPVGLFIPIIIGKGPVPDGIFIGEDKVIVLPLSVTVIVNEPPE